MSTLVIDPNIFFWDENDFNNDITKYKKLVDDLMSLLEILEKDRNNILMSIEMTKLILNSFPTIDNNFDIGTLFRRFIANSMHRFKDYPDYIVDNIQTKPYIINFLLSNEIQYEAKKLYSELLLSTEIQMFISNSAFFPYIQYLRISSSKHSKKINCLVVLEHIVDFLNRIRRRYEPHTKHDKVIGWGSPLYADRETVEEMLFKAIKAPKGNSFALYYYYQTNSSFIIFRPHRDDKYHAYEVIDTNEIPPDVKNELTHLYATGKVNKIKKAK